MPFKRNLNPSSIPYKPYRNSGVTEVGATTKTLPGGLILNHVNTLTVTCPCCFVSIELTSDNIRQADFKRKFPKRSSLSKSEVLQALDGHVADDPADDTDTAPED